MKLFKSKHPVQDPLELEVVVEIHTQAKEPIFAFPASVMASVQHLVNQAIKNSSPIGEDLHAEIEAGKIRTFPRRLSMVSAMRGEGVTYLTWALSASLVHDFLTNVCIIDLNWWSPFYSPVNPPGAPGVADILKKRVDLPAAIRKTRLPGLDYLSSGSLERADRSRFARSKDLTSLVDALSEQYDHLILDIPAIRNNNDAPYLVGLGHACCLVIRQGATPIVEAQNALDEIDHVPMLGSVLNQVKYVSPGWVQQIFNTQA